MRWHLWIKNNQIKCKNWKIIYRLHSLVKSLKLKFNIWQISDFFLIFGICKENYGALTAFCLFVCLVLYQLCATTFCERSEGRTIFLSLQGKYSKYILNISITIMYVETILVTHNQCHGQLWLCFPKTCPAPKKTWVKFDDTRAL